ncbi:MAG: 50S ribosomal protein L25/general stress protein Ctc [Candidatus Limimorpha sp.]|nr:50S ribosomal protein L25/general stress protein Ctc [Bacteroidales bacterium]MDD7277371.1 50S ribosomal protein L25/general stress protein Ctc [Bacteroidales bacterium]MDY6075902.1 50S ribosomal protein L25/general stress protein Ctc [Bacteroidales bacterium]
MNSVSLSGSLRENVGKKDAKALRKNGQVPCVIYGNNIEQVKFYTDARSFKKILYTPETLIIDFEINGTVYHTILQDIQYHPVTDEVLHADFLDVNEDNPITVTLPIRTEGTSPGVMRGGRLNKNLAKLKVRGLVNDLPDNITLDISKLNLNQSIKVKDITLDKIEVLVPSNTIIVDVKAPRNANVEETSEEE